MMGLPAHQGLVLKGSIICAYSFSQSVLLERMGPRPITK